MTEHRELELAERIVKATSKRKVRIGTEIYTFYCIEDVIEFIRKVFLEEINKE